MMLETIALLIALSPRAPVQDLILGDLPELQEVLELQGTLRSGWMRSSGEHHLGADAALELGLTERLQLEVMVPFAWSISSEESAGGVGNIEVEAAVNLLPPQPGRPTISMVLGVEFPSLSESAGEEEYGGELALVVHQQLDLVHVAGKAALEVPELGSELVLSFFLAPLPVSPLLELSAHLAEERTYSVAAGAVIPTDAGFEVGAGVPVTFSEAGEMPEFGVLVWASYELELLQEQEEEEEE
jgi:hypothetical protein